MRYCIHHKDKLAVARCKTCMSPICEECIVKHKGEVFCSSGCAEKYFTYQEKQEELDSYSKGFRRKNAIKSGIKKILWLVFILGIAYYVYQSGWI